MMRILQVMVLGLWGAGFTASPQVTAPLVIEMTPNMMFRPSEMTVQVGEVVVWKNASEVLHSVNTVADHCKTEEGKKWVRIPTGATNFFSGEIQPGAEFRIRFEIPGVYQYLCTFHEDQSMRGTIVVQGSSAR